MDNKKAISDWHIRFKQQARWTSAIRSFIFNAIDIHQATRILDVGCGTGAIESELVSRHSFFVHGLDINGQYLSYAKDTGASAIYTQADAYHTPYETGIFDACICHFFLLWIANPVPVLNEIKRITRPGGKIIAIAEPDYGGRIDYPPDLEVIGRLQVNSLREQGADPQIGRKLPALFHRAGLIDVTSGLLGGQWTKQSHGNEWLEEWQMIEYDFNLLPDPHVDIDQLKVIDAEAIKSGEKVLYVPTFYAWGTVPQ